MLDSLPKLLPGEFPAIRRAETVTLQVNLGYLCNQQCLHCHVAAGPSRAEIMDGDTAGLVIDAMNSGRFTTLDLTGGAPEMNPGFRDLVRSAAERDIHVIDRCNLSILNEPGHEDLAAFLASHGVEIVASLPCYLEENVDRQRGNGVFASSIEGLTKLNTLGYGIPGSGLSLNLVYNPQDASLPPPQASLEADYRRMLDEQYSIRFSNLLTLANLPVGRFGSSLQSLGKFDDYLALLKDAHRNENLDAVMCRTLVSVDWQGYLYDCDFNQMLGLPMWDRAIDRPHLRDLNRLRMEERPIAVADHCFGCTAGQGSSCGGALGIDDEH
ncbi:MAG: arsenosugar biosynthesis radical SAM protein ArsS [Chromatiales bacterium]|jgi:radical SAM/Cys-rich protein